MFVGALDVRWWFDVRGIARNRAVLGPLSRNPAQKILAVRAIPGGENFLGFLGRRNPQLRRIARQWVFLLECVNSSTLLHVSAR